MRRFFFDPVVRDGNKVLLSEAESRHIAKSLRLHVGSQIQLFDGTGMRYLAEIVSVGSRVLACILNAEDDLQNRCTPVHLGQAMLKNSKMDFVVEKSTELGVASFTPILSSRCQGKFEDEQSGNKRRERWQRIVESACKQCSRSYPMEVKTVLSLADWRFGGSEESRILRLLFWEEEKTITLHDLPALAEYDQIYLLLGPEGGFSKEEVAHAGLAGYQSISLGRQILRAETATLAAISIVRYLTGDS